MKPIFLTYNDLIKDKVVSFINEWENDLDFFVTQTSGSTGKPKEIKILKKYAIHSAKTTCIALKLDSKSKVLLCLDVSTIGGKMMIVRSIVNKMNLFVSDVNANPLKELNEDIDFIAIVPLQLSKILEESPEKLKAIKNVIVGGGTISKQLEDQLKVAKITVFQTYGMTETISHIALRKVGYEGTDYYETLPGININTFENQLVIHASNLGIDELVTNDLVEQLSPTRFKWLGRKDFVINSGGIKIIPEVLEQELSVKLQLPFFITQTPDEILGSKVILVVEGIESIELETKAFYSMLPKYHVPKEICFLPSFIRTASGKVDRIQTIKQCNASGFRKIL